MRQTHRAGEKLFVADAGQGLPGGNSPSGEGHEVAICVAVLGASNATYARRPGPRACRPGLAHLCGPLRPSVGSPRGSSPTTSRRP
jgi:hypothetical protein